MANISAETRIKINAHPKEVFEYLSVLKYHYLWNPSLRKLSSEKPLGLNKNYVAEVVILKDIHIKSKNVVTKFVQDQCLCLENQVGLVKFTQEYIISKTPNGSEITTKTNILTASQAFGLTLPVLKRLARRELQSDLELLKIAVEHKLGQ